MRRLLSVIIVLGLVMGLAVAAYADLIDRGGGLIYDDVLNITWLQDANLSATNTFGITGWNANRNTWTATQDWITAMNAANYLGFSNWRLPTTLPVNGSSYNFFYHDGIPNP